MERVFDFQLEKVKTKLIKICSLIDEQFELLHETFKLYDSKKIDKIIEKNDEIKYLKEGVEINCQKIFVLTQPVATDLRDVLLFLKINVLLKNINHTIVDLISLVEKHSTFNFEIELKDIYEASYATLDMIKSSFDAFIVNDLELAGRIVSSETRFDDVIEGNEDFLEDIIKNNSSTTEAVFNLLTFLNELTHIKKYCMELCEDVLILNDKKE